MINKLVEIRKEFVDSVKESTPVVQYFGANFVSCISMAIDYLNAYEKSIAEPLQDSEKVS